MGSRHSASSTTSRTRIRSSDGGPFDGLSTIKEGMLTNQFWGDQTLNHSNFLKVLEILDDFGFLGVAQANFHGKDG